MDLNKQLLFKIIIQRSFFEMLKQHTLNQHRRNKSQLMACAPSQLPKTKKKVSTANSNTRKQRTPTNSKKTLNPNLINSLLNKSTKKANRKQILVEDIDQVPEEEGSEDFFCFGKGYANNKLRQVEPYMQEIIEVPDTGSYSQRNTEQEQHLHQNQDNKQNVRETANYPPEIQEKFFRLSRNQERGSGADNPTVALLSYRQANNCSRRSSNHSQRSECSQTHSTVELSRQKLKLSRSKSRGKQESKNELKMLREKTAKMQKNIKMIWECMGEIWDNSRNYKHLAQRNSQNMSDLSHRVLQNQKLLLQLKLETGRKNKDFSFRG